MVLPGRLFGSRSESRDAGRRRVRGLHAFARRRRPLDQGDVHRSRDPRTADDRPSRDRSLRRRAAVQRRHSGRFQRRRPGRHADGGGADLYSRRPGAGGANAQGRARRLAPDTRQARGGSRAPAGKRRRPVRCPWRLPFGARLRGDAGAGVQGAIGRGGQEPLVLWASRLATHRAGDGLPGRRPRARQRRLRRRRHDDVRRDLSRHRSVRADRLHLRDASRRAEDLGFPRHPADQARGRGRTKLLVDEQGAFLDGYDDAGSRERGTGDLLDKLGASLRG